MTETNMPLDDQVVTINDLKLRFGDLPPELKQSVMIMSRWNIELSEARLEVMKLELALQALTTEITRTLKQAQPAQNS